MRNAVARFKSGGSELVLPGDIPRAVESEIAAALAPLPPHLVLQVPHHGSKTSSSIDFIADLHPALGLITAGYMNRFHHPNKDVVARYATAGVDLLNSARAGFVAIRFAPDATAQVIEQGRRDRHPYWRED